MTVISVDEQLELMETLACSGGHTSYEAVRAEMLLVLDKEYGRGEYELEPIPRKCVNDLNDWLAADD